MVKTDNHTVRQARGKYVVQYSPEWKREVNHANKGKVGAPYQYSETLIMLTAALRVGIGVRYRQLEGIIGKMIGESNTPRVDEQKVEGKTWFCKDARDG